MCRPPIGDRLSLASRDMTLWLAWQTSLGSGGKKQLQAPGLKEQPLDSNSQQQMPGHMELLQRSGKGVAGRMQEHQYEYGPYPLRTSVSETSNGSCTLKSPYFYGRNAQTHRRGTRRVRMVRMWSALLTFLRLWQFASHS